MIALSGFSRFPVFFSGDGKTKFGHESKDEAFNEYVQQLISQSRSKFIAIKSLKNIQYRSRLVVNQKAINPETRKGDVVPGLMFIYPDIEPGKTMNNALTFGFTLKGTGSTIYIPLLMGKMLTKKEIKTALNIAMKKTMDFTSYQEIVRELGITLTLEKSLVNDTHVLAIHDPEIHDEYKVLVNQDYKVLDVDFCIDNYEQLYLLELMFFARESRFIHHLTGFNY